VLEGDGVLRVAVLGDCGAYALPCSKFPPIRAEKKGSLIQRPWVYSGLGFDGFLSEM
jgi:hypothetical protein